MLNPKLNNRFTELIDKYLPLIDVNGTAYSYESYFSHKLKNLDMDELLIPVIGVQGTGKSSFLNALLMDDIVLPVDADETTCIPIEIRYSSSKIKNIEVYFNYQAEPHLLHDTNQLKQYVHSTQNCKNEKNVSHIVIYINNEMLKNGVVFVDLPGVLSLSEINTKIVMNYVEKLSAAIFLVRSVPPITSSEKVFISRVWPMLTKAWFIQNQWNDESKREVLEGLEQNIQILKEISIKQNINEDINIQVVHVYHALSGRIQQDEELLKSSGLIEVEKIFLEFGSCWKKALTEKWNDDIKMLIVHLEANLKEKLTKVQDERSELLKQYQSQERLLEKLIKNKIDKVSQLKKKIQQFEFEILQFAHQQCKVQGGALHVEMLRIINRKVVDGERLKNSFYEIQRNLASEILEELNKRFHEINKIIHLYQAEIMTPDQNVDFEDFVIIQSKQEFKFEKGLVPVFTIGGTLYGIALGSQIGMLFGGLFGTAIGGGVGLFISLLSGWFGKESMEYIQKERGKSSLKFLETPIRDFQEKLQRSIVERVNHIFNDYYCSIQQYLHHQEREILTQIEKSRNDIRLLEEELKRKQITIEEDISFLESWGGNL